MSNKILLIIIVIGVIAIGGLFYTGYKINTSSLQEPSPSSSVDASSTPLIPLSSTPQAQNSKLTPKVWETPSGQIACNFLLNKNDLLQVLPPPPKGYENSAHSQVYDYPLSGEITAAVAYVGQPSSGKTDRKIEISITETCGNASAPWNGEGSIYKSSDQKIQTTEAIMIAGNKALKKHFLVLEDSYSYTILVGKHILIHVNGESGTPDADVASSANAINYTKLNELLAPWDF